VVPFLSGAGAITVRRVTEPDGATLRFEVSCERGLSRAQFAAYLQVVRSLGGQFNRTALLYAVSPSQRESLWARLNAVVALRGVELRAGGRTVALRGDDNANVLADMASALDAHDQAWRNRHASRWGIGGR
jgi:hypothetical protein